MKENIPYIKSLAVFKRKKIKKEICIGRIRL